MSRRINRCDVVRGSYVLIGGSMPPGGKISCFKSSLQAQCFVLCLFVALRSDVKLSTTVLVTCLSDSCHEDHKTL